MIQDYDLKGFKELQAMLDTLPAKIEKNILQSALRAGAKVAKERAEQIAPRKTGRLSRSLRLSARTRRGRVTASAKTGVYYAKFVESGTKPHDIPKQGKKAFLSFGGKVFAGVRHPGIRAQRFMARALDESTPRAIQAVADQIRKRLTKAGLNTPGNV